MGLYFFLLVKKVLWDGKVGFKSALKHTTDKQYDKYVFRGIKNTKNGQKLRKIDKLLSYTTVRGHVLDLLANKTLDPKKFGLYSLRSGGASVAANLGVNDILFKKHGMWKSDKVKNSYVLKDIESKLSVSRNLGL